MKPSSFSLKLPSTNVRTAIKYLPFGQSLHWRVGGGNQVNVFEYCGIFLIVSIYSFPSSDVSQLATFTWFKKPITE
jgi:hypothetical protein